MENIILQQNIACLPEALRAMLPASNQTPSSIETIRTRQGLPVALIKSDKKQVLSNSLIDPYGESARWASTLDYKDVMVSIIYGCGFGYPLIEYAKRKQPYTQTIVIERDVELFYAMLGSIDLRPILQDPAYHFVIGNQDEIKSQINAIFTSDFLLRATKPACFFTWHAHRRDKSFYLAIHEWLWNTLELTITSVGNSVHDTLVGMYNMLDNVDSVLKSPRLSSLRHTFRRKPAIIVANGPSLDKNIDLLAKAKGRALILTAESALKPCLKRNIAPDAVCVIERTPTSYEVHFKQADLPEELVLIGLNLMDPRIPVEFPGPWVPVFRQYESTSRWINETISDNIGLIGGSSSAHLAFELALWVEADPIIFVGQDLAFGPGYTTHSQHSSYSEQYLAQQVQILQAQPVFMVKGVDGKPLPTIKIWYEFKTWFEQQILLHPERQFIDATEGGAYIAGTRLMTLEEAIEKFCREPLPISLYETVKRLVPKDPVKDRKKKYEVLLGHIDRIRTRFIQLAQAAEEDVRNCRLVEKACSLHAKYQAPLPDFVESLYNKNTNGFRKFGSEEEIVTFTQSLIFACHKQINDVGEVDTVERLLKVTQIQRSMFEHLKGICLEMVKHFNLAENRLKRRIEKDDDSDAGDDG